MVENGKNITLLAESDYSANAAVSPTITSTEVTMAVQSSGTTPAYAVVTGNFLKFVGTGGAYDISGTTVSDRTASTGEYILDTPAGGEPYATTYNVRNDYTITQASSLYLGDVMRGNAITEPAPAGQAVITVEEGGALYVRKAPAPNQGAGSLTFDGNRSYPVEGPMFQVKGDLTFYTGITVMNCANYSEAHPGAVEVCSGGELTIDDGVTFTGNVSPVAGTVYVAEGGQFTMNGGTFTDNVGAMPRYGFNTEDDAKFSGGTNPPAYDTSFWGQPKYYYGAGAIYNAGQFTMNGGTLSDNRGEYGALANSGTANLIAGTITDNHALTGTGAGTEYPLAITAYTEGVEPAIGSDRPGAGYGGGIYAGAGGTVEIDGVDLSDNTAEIGGGGIAAGLPLSGARKITGYAGVNGAFQSATVDGTTTSIAAAVPRYNAAAQSSGAAKVTILGRTTLSGNSAGSKEGTMGGGVYVGGWYGGSAGGGDQVTTVTAGPTAQITANRAADGAGAYLNTVTGDADAPDFGPKDPSGDLGTELEGAKAGRLILNGTALYNNTLTGITGYGAGIYNRGDLVLRAESAAEGAQPYLASNDTVYLEAGHWITAENNVNLARNASAPLTIASRETENNTVILKAGSPALASEILSPAGGGAPRIQHSGSVSLAQDDESDPSVIEINSYTITYWTGLPNQGGVQYVVWYKKS